MTSKLTSFLFALVLIAFIVAARLAPHPANFAPVAAIGLFAGYYFSRRMAVVIPLIGMLVSDLFIGFYHMPVMFSVYFALLLPVVLGAVLRKHGNLWNGITFTMASSIFFFALTNLAVWAFSGMYERTASGLLQSYAMAIPFFKYTLAGDLSYSALLFGAYFAVVAVRLPAKPHEKTIV
jgi:hypothetical protein